jgi:hypothetical protein
MYWKRNKRAVSKTPALIIANLESFAATRAKALHIHNNNHGVNLATQLLGVLPAPELTQVSALR